MYGLISLYLGYLIYLIIFFRFRKRNNSLYKKITIFLGVKLLFLTILYFVFFDNKITKEERQNDLQNLVTTNFSYGFRIS